MSTDATYPVSSPSLPAPVAGDAGFGAAIVGGQAFLGFGLLRPFVRDQKLDWAAAGGVRLVKAALGQILGTRAASEFTEGELPWRDEFGSLLHLLRHRNNDETTRELARVYVAGAVARWEPRVRITGVAIRAEEVEGQGKVAVAILVRFDLIRRNVPGNQVLLPGLEVEVPLA